MKKLTMIWTLIGLFVTLAAVGAAVFFFLRKRAEKAAQEEIDEIESPAEPEAAAAAQSA